MSKITGGGYLPEWSGLVKIMAIDLGDARTGVAVSDTLGMLTGQTSVIESWNKEKPRSWWRRHTANRAQSGW